MYHLIDKYSLNRYFNEAWAMAVFHDRFSDFRDEIKEILFSDQVSLVHTRLIDHQFYKEKIQRNCCPNK